MDNHETSAIDKLVEKLREKDEELAKAGQYGKSLLDTNAHLENVLQRTNEEYENKLEDLEQQKYNLEVKVEEFRTREEQAKGYYLCEKQALLAEHHTQQDMLEKNHKKALFELNTKNSDIQRELDETLLMNEQLKDKVEQQQSVISELRASHPKKDTSCDSSPDTEGHAKQNIKLQDELDHLQYLNERLQNENEQLNWKKEELERVNEFFKEEKERVQEELQTYRENLEETQMEVTNLTNQLESLKSQPQDPNSRGNSLFAEVDDKRQQAEKKLISAQVKLKCMEKKYTQQANYAMKLKSQIAQLLQAGGRHADRERIAHLEQSLACSQCDIKSRNEKIAELEQKISINFDEKLNEMKKSENSHDDFVEFLEKLLKKKDVEISKMKKELQVCHTDLLAESRRVSAAECKIYSAQSESDKFKAQVVKLKIELSRMKLKCGEDVQGKRSTRPGKIEKIPIDEPHPGEEYENINPIQQEALNITEASNAGNQVSVTKKEVEVKRKSENYSLAEAPAECKQQ